MFKNAVFSLIKRLFFQGGFIIYSTINTIPGKEIIKIVDVVTGNVVQAKHIERDISR